jgi:hypothetical protein
MRKKRREEAFNGPWFPVKECWGGGMHSPARSDYCVQCGLVYRKINKVTGGPIFIGASGQSLKIKYRLLLRDGNKCHYCRERFDEKENQPTIDHVVAKSKGGENRIENYVLACYDCNQRKGDMSRHDFLMLLAEEELELDEKQPEL